MDRSDVSSMMPPISEETAVCPTHGEYTARYIVIGDGDRRGGRCPECVKADDKAEKDRERARREQLARDERARALEELGVWPRHLGKTFENFRAETPQQIRALKECMALAERVQANPRGAPSIILVGNPGTGKTHLACAMVQQLFGLRTVLRRDFADIIDHIRSTWKKTADKSQRDIIEYYGSLDLLIIDEVGKQYGSDDERLAMFRILDRRSLRMLPTMLLSNLSPEDLKQDTGDAVLDRLREDGGKMWPLTGESHRGRDA